MSGVPHADLGSAFTENSVCELNVAGAAPLVDVAALRSHVSDEAPARVIGSITSTDPAYVQDRTAGVRLDASKDVSFHIGDQMYLLGRPRLSHGASVFVPDEARRLWAHGPVEPLAIASSQAATGKYNGTLIEISGMLVSRKLLPDDAVRLELVDGAQRFLVQVASDAFGAASTGFAVGSRLLVQGICATDIDADGKRPSFVLRPTHRRMFCFSAAHHGGHRRTSFGWS